MFLYFVKRLYRTLRVDFRSKLTTSVEGKEKSLICILFSLVCPDRNRSPQNSELVKLWIQKIHRVLISSRLLNVLHDVLQNSFTTIQSQLPSLWETEGNSLPQLKLATEKFYFSQRPGIKALGNIPDDFPGHRSSEQAITHLMRYWTTSTALQRYSPWINKAWIPSRLQAFYYLISLLITLGQRTCLEQLPRKSFPVCTSSPIP